MALRAGYYGLKRSLKDKLFNLAASTPADIGPDNPIAGKNDVLASISLLKDTTGWTGKSKVPNTASSTSSGNVAFTVNENKTVKVVANNNSAYQALTINSNIGDYLEVGKRYTLCGTPLKPSGASYRQFELRIRKNSNNDVVASDAGNSVEFTYTQEMAQADTYRLDIAIFDGTTYDGLFAPMITTPEEYKLSPTYEPYHESVEELLNSYSDITDVYTASFNDFVGKYKKLGAVYTFTCEGTKIGTSWNAFTIKGVNTPIESHLFLGKDNLGLNWYAINNGSDVIVQCRILTDQSEKSTFSGSMILVPTSANREMSEPEPATKEVTKKATKKKVIKED